MKGYDCSSSSDVWRSLCVNFGVVLSCKLICLEGLIWNPLIVLLLEVNI